MVSGGLGASGATHASSRTYVHPDALAITPPRTLRFAHLGLMGDAWIGDATRPGAKKDGELTANYWKLETGIATKHESEQDLEAGCCIEMVPELADSRLGEHRNHCLRPAERT